MAQQEVVTEEEAEGKAARTAGAAVAGEAVAVAVAGGAVAVAGRAVAVAAPHKQRGGTRHSRHNCPGPRTCRTRDHPRTKS